MDHETIRLRLATRVRRALSLEGLTPAAVLVLLVRHSDAWPDAWTVLFTQRTAHLANHAGQIAFPGGHIDPTDADATQAALRETEEEVGLPRGRVEVAGLLDDHCTGTGFRITPVVGVADAPLTLTLDPHEVAEAFEAPLSFFLDATNHQRKTLTVQGRDVPVYAMPYENRYIWGATAAILRNLHEAMTDQ